MKFRTEIWHLATILDPRFKNLATFAELSHAAWHMLRELYENENAGEIQEGAGTNETHFILNDFVAFPSTLGKKRKLAEFLQEVGEQRYHANEVDRYYLEAPMQLDEDPLTWWKSKQTQYPNLSQIARRYLCIPCTSVPCERLFSDAGNVITKKRASLDPETVEKLMFLYENSDLIEH